ncbi:hypothetical protein CPT_Machias_252 [Staphylococcus phage Machias]|nr:hypothetical protein CPT_Machias_252 [Staphylococcus phage Machias]
MRKELSDYINKEKLDALSIALQGDDFDSLEPKTNGEVFEKYLKLEKLHVEYRYEESLSKIAEGLKDISRKESDSSSVDKESNSSSVDKEAILSVLKNFASKI